MPKKSNTQDNQDSIIRHNWGKSYTALPKLDLLAIQKTSYERFLATTIGEILEEISPIDDFTGKNWSLSLHEYRLGKATNTPDEALAKGLTFDAPLYVKVKLLNKKTDAVHESEVFLGDIPQMTVQGSFIVNGIERAVVNQLVRSPGSFFTATQDPATGKTLYSAEIRPVHGSWLEFTTTRYGTMTVKIDRRRKFPVTTFLRAIGISGNETIKERFQAYSDNDKEGFIENTLLKDETGSETEALIEIFKKMHPGEPIVIDKVREAFMNLFFNNRRYDLGVVGRYKMNKRLKNLPGFSESDERV
jgi:DNA-directed RNA polymerase subunit beta